MQGIGKGREMLAYWSDKLACWRMQARYERVVRERMLELLEARGSRPQAEEAGDWRLLGQEGSRATPSERAEERNQARRVVRENPHARNILRLLEAYVVGEGLQMSFVTCSSDPSEQTCDVGERIDELWPRIKD